MPREDSPGTAGPVAPTVPVRNPYKGLHAFQEADASDFFGRDQLNQAVLDRVDSQAGFAAVVGPSGSGKSSIVRAGVIPRLRRRPGRFVLTMVPGANPFAEVESALLRIAVNPPAVFIDQLVDGVGGARPGGQSGSAGRIGRPRARRRSVRGALHPRRPLAARSFPRRAGCGSERSTGTTTGAHQPPCRLLRSSATARRVRSPVDRRPR